MKVHSITAAILVAFTSLAMADRDADDARKAAEEAANGGRPELSDEIKAQKESYEEERKALRNALKAEISALGADATRDQVKEVVANFKNDNAVSIEAQREVADALREAVKEARDAQLENAPDGVKEIRDLLVKSRGDKKASRDALREALAVAETNEDRKALLNDHRAEQRDLHKQVRDELKKLREDIRNGGNGGDRRNEE